MRTARKKPPQHLTDTIVKRHPLPPSGNWVTWDTTVSGFGVCLTAAGARSFVFNYRVRGTGRQRRFTIGSASDWATSAARAKAKELRRQVDDGGDPLEDLEAERSAPTVADLIKRFETEHLPRKRAGTAVDYRSMIERYIRPAFKNLKVADVRFEDIDRLHRKITAAGHARRANTVVAVLSRMFSLAVRWGMRDSNPAKGIERNTEIMRKRYLTADELASLVKALAEHPDQQSANVIRVLLLTGARRGEVLAMQWADLDLAAGIWSKPASSVKQNEDHVVPLSAPVRQLLAEVRQQQTAKRRPLGQYVFPGGGNTGHVVELKRSWRSLCKAADISGLRIHDLRHSFASQLASGGASLPLIGALLCHSNPTTTHRYSHLFVDPQRAAVERVGAVIGAAGKPAKEPTKIKR